MSEKAEVIEKWTEIEDTMLIDIKRGETKPAPGHPWRYYLTAWDVEVRKLKSGPREFATRRLIEIVADTEDEVNEKARAIVDAARLVSEGSRR
jgi:hypothetical protein